MSGLDDPIVVEPIVSSEKLGELLGWQTEYPSLEFKGDLAIAVAEGIIELAKDVGAMQVQGGYVVIGVDGRGAPTGKVTQDARPHYDEARLVPRLEKYLPEPINLRSAVHEIKGDLVALIYVGLHPSGCAFFHADGHYMRGDREVPVFRAGEVFWRKGTQSVRLNQQGFEEVVRRRVEEAKRTWLQDHRQAVIPPASGAEAITLVMDTPRLVAALLDALETGRTIAVQRVFIEAATSARRLVEEDDFDVEVGVVVDKLASIAATALRYRRADLLDQVIGCLHEIFDIGYTPEFSAYSVGLPADLRGPRLWLLIAERVYAIGALAVRLEAWDSIPKLAVHEVRATDRTTSPWLRHALTMASRAGHLNRELSLLNLARRHIDQNECLRIDGIRTDAETVMSSLTQFDLLVALAVIGASGRLDEGDFYPNFSRFYSERVIPMVERVIAPNSAIRKVIFPLDDVDLARALGTIEKWAQREGWSYAGFHDFGLDIEDWITQHRAE